MQNTTRIVFVKHSKLHNSAWIPEYNRTHTNDKNRVDHEYTGNSSRWVVHNREKMFMLGARDLIIYFEPDSSLDPIR